MAYDVNLTHFPYTLIGKSDIKFKVRDNNDKIGELGVSKGNIFWCPTGCSYGYYLSWNKFAEFMSREGKRHNFKF